jgi:hypothetical protein
MRKVLDITLPVYWEHNIMVKDDESPSGKKKKVKSKNLISMNFVQNLNIHKRNVLKKYYHQMVAKNLRERYSIEDFDDFKKETMFCGEYIYYYSNSNSDLDNVISEVKKFFLDGLAETHLIQNDNVKHQICNSEYAIEDKSNPRVEIRLTFFLEGEKPERTLFKDKGIW